LFRRGGFGVAGPGNHQPEAEFPQPTPAGLGAGLDAPAVPDVGGDLRPRPQAAVGRLPLQGVVQLGQLGGGQLARALVVAAAVGQALGPEGVPAPEDSAGVDVGQPYQGGSPLAAEGLAGPQEEPDQVPARLLLGVGATAVTTAYLLYGKVAAHG